MRHLSLRKLIGTQRPARPGRVVFYAADDGALQSIDEDGNEAAVSPWVKHVLGATADEWVEDGAGTWEFADGVISQTDPTADSKLLSVDAFPGLEFVIEADVRIPSGQDGGVTAEAWTAAGTQTDDTVGVSYLLGEGFVFGLDGPGDGGSGVLAINVDGNATTGPSPFPTDAVQDEWHKVRAVVSATRQSVYIDGEYVLSGETITGGNDPAYAVDQDLRTTDRVGIGAIGRIDYRNVKVWTRALP